MELCLITFIAGRRSVEKLSIIDVGNLGLPLPPNSLLILPVELLPNQQKKEFLKSDPTSTTFLYTSLQPSPPTHPYPFKLTALLSQIRIWNQVKSLR